MSTASILSHFQDTASALSIARQLRRHEGWTRPELQAYQHLQLQRLVQHAVRRSPFYRELYGPGVLDREVRLHDLPVVDKRTLMDHFDQVVTDPRLHLADVEAHVERLSRDELYLGRYRVLPTSGSTGRRGLFVYDRLAWSNLMAGAIRLGARMGLKPRLLPRLRFSSVAAHDVRHMSYRLAGSLGMGLSHAQRLEATAPIPELVSALNAFQPEVLLAYPSIGALLAHEQLEGRLRIRPAAVITAAEVRTDDMAQRMGAAWGPNLFDVYALTEALVGAETTEHAGIEVLEELVILEVVNEHNEPVPPGWPGSKLLLTNLFNWTQPLIRYEISDMLTLAEGASASGRPFSRIQTIEGRSDDIIYLPGIAGGQVAVHPLHFRSPLLSFGEIVQYQVEHDEGLLTLRLVLSDDARAEASSSRARAAILEALRTLGVQVPDMDVEVVHEIGREVAHTGKLKLVVCKLRRRAEAAAPVA